MVPQSHSHRALATVTSLRLQVAFILASVLFLTTTSFHSIPRILLQEQSHDDAPPYAVKGVAPSHDRDTQILTTNILLDGGSTTSITTAMKGAGASNAIGNRPFQLLVLTPKEGFVVAIISPAYRKIPMHLYLDRRDTFLLLHENKTFSKSFTGSEYHAEVIFAWFDIGRKQWNEWKRAPPQTLVVQDPLQLGEQYHVPLLVDPALRKQSKEGESSHSTKKHRFAAATIVRKILRHYNGKNSSPGEMTHPELKPKWDDAETVQRLKFWMQHNEQIGIEHFYIVDNEVDTSKPNLKGIEQMESVTYIRLPHIHFDGYRLDEEQDLRGVRYGFPGQVVIENAILRMACTDWLLYTDLDELVVPALSYNYSLAGLVDHFKDKSCTFQGNETIECRLLEYPKEGIFQMTFANALIDAQDRLTGIKIVAGKVAVRPDYTKAMMIHYGEASSSSFYHADIPPKHGFMAHYHALKNFSPDLLSGAKKHAKEMTLDYCLNDECNTVSNHHNE